MKPALFAFVRPLYSPPLVVHKAEGCWIEDEGGNRYLDGYAGVATVAVGHSHPHVNARVKEQIDRVQHTSMLYQTRALFEYLEIFQTQLPSRLSRHFFVNSGSEALDFACQAVRAHRRKPLVICMSEGFHGGSFQSKSMTGLPAWQPAYGMDPQVWFYAFPRCLDCSEARMEPKSKRLSRGPSSCSASCLTRLEEFLDREAGRTAALALEPILGVGGILFPESGFFRRLQRICRKYDIDLICDEVQTGFGRCGATLFAFQALGLEPDLLCMGKGIANGFPMGMISATEEISEALQGKLHFSTFGGNPVSCAAAKATLEVIRRENLIRNAETVGEYLMTSLDRTFSSMPACREIRGAGLMIGIEFERPETALAIVNGAYQRRLLIGIGGRNRNVVRIEPPLVFTKEMADQTVATILQAAAEATQSGDSSRP